MARYFTLRAETPEQVETTDRETDEKISADLIVAQRYQPLGAWPIPSYLAGFNLLELVSDAFHTMATYFPSRRLLVRIDGGIATAWVMR